MAKEADNSFGIASVILGILSIVLASVPGIIFGIIGLFFASKQKKIHANKWSKAGFILAIIGIILSVVVIYLAVKYSSSLLQYAPQ